MTMRSPYAPLALITFLLAGAFGCDGEPVTSSPDAQATPSGAIAYARVDPAQVATPDARMLRARTIATTIGEVTGILARSNSNAEVDRAFQSLIGEAPADTRAIVEQTAAVHMIRRLDRAPETSPEQRQLAGRYLALLDENESPEATTIERGLVLVGGEWTPERKQEVAHRTAERATVLVAVKRDCEGCDAQTARGGARVVNGTPTEMLDGAAERLARY